MSRGQTEAAGRSGPTDGRRLAGGLHRNAGAWRGGRCRPTEDEGIPRRGAKKGLSEELPRHPRAGRGRRNLNHAAKKKPKKTCTPRGGERGCRGRGVHVGSSAVCLVELAGCLDSCLIWGYQCLYWPVGIVREDPPGESCL